MTTNKKTEGEKLLDRVWKERSSDRQLVGVENETTTPLPPADDPNFVAYEGWERTTCPFCGIDWILLGLRIDTGAEYDPGALEAYECVCGAYYVGEIE